MDVFVGGFGLLLCTAALVGGVGLLFLSFGALMAGVSCCFIRKDAWPVSRTIDDSLLSSSCDCANNTARSWNNNVSNWLTGTEG